MMTTLWMQAPYFRRGGGAISKPCAPTMSEDHKFSVLLAQMSDEQFSRFLDLIRADVAESVAPYQASHRAGLEVAFETDRATRFQPASDHL